MPALHRRRYISMLSTALAAWATASVAWAASLSGIDRADLDAYIEQARIEWQVPGVVVGAIKDGAVVFAKGYGVREAGRAAPIDDHSLFQIGSLTKALTTAALGMLVDEGRIHWDDAVIEHLPEFRLADPWLTRHVTIRDLVAHRAGVEGGAYVVVPMDAARNLREASRLETRVPFRQTLLYSNTMYDIAGSVVTAVAGKSWGEFLEQRLFQPLGMRDSHSSAETAGIWDESHLAPSMYGQAPAGTAGIDDAQGADVAMPHWLTPAGSKPLPWQIYSRGGGAAGSAVSNLHDLLRWLRFNLDEGRDAAGKALLRPDTFAELHAPQVLIRTPPSHFYDVVARIAQATDPGRLPSAYAMGWFSNSHRGHLYLKHTGALVGQMSMIAMLPERRMGVVALSNSYGRGGSGLLTEVIALRALDTLLAVEPHDWSREFLRAEEANAVETSAAETQLQKARLQGTRPTLPLTGYTGEYQNPQVDKVKIALVGEQLVLRLPGAADWRLEHWHNDTFRLHVSTSGVDLMQFFLTFHVDPAGKVASFDPGWTILGDAFVPVATR